MHIKFLLLKVRNPLGDMDVDERITLKWIRVSEEPR